VIAGPEFVAVTGDGIDRAPTEEDPWGIARGITGTEATREATVMTLTDGPLHHRQRRGARPQIL
jgi:hypothetical protein